MMDGLDLLPPSPTDPISSLNAAVPRCTSCPLHLTPGCHGPVPGYGSSSSPIVIVGEAPGRMENDFHRPFVGPAGKELAMYLRRIQLDVDSLYRTNVVKCWPGNGDPTPSPAAISQCSSLWLQAELSIIRPIVVVACGESAVRAFWNEEDDPLLEPLPPMREIHGIPRHVTWRGLSFILLPAYHPAAGLHETSNMLRIRHDFSILSRLIFTGPTIPISDFRAVDSHPSPTYLGVDDLCLPPDTKFVALDTETYPDGSLLCFSLSYAEGSGFVVRASDLPRVEHVFYDPSIHWIFHNAPFDIEVFRRAGITTPFLDSTHVHDTIILAAMLQLEARGLKFLSKRYLGMTMEDYEDIVSPYQLSISCEYLASALQFMTSDSSSPWPDPQPIEEAVWDKAKGEFAAKIKRPQNLVRKIKHILADTANGKCKDPWKRWHDIPLPERKMLEENFTVMPQATLDLVSDDRRIHYSARDADATLRLFNLLYPQVIDHGMGSVYHDLDIPATIVTSDMMRNGMPVSRSSLFALRSKFLEKQQVALADCWRAVGGLQFNPNSPVQVANLLFARLRLPSDKRTATGAFSTDDDILIKISSRHPVVPLILEYRRLGKMLDAFVTPLLLSSERDGRVHCDLRSTGTETGRMAASDPNLMAMPVRHQEGKDVRDCFVARDGFSLFSADLSQIEMRIMAHLSQDAGLIDLFRSGRDVHAETAASIFRIPLAEVDETRHRYPAKRTGFGVMYGITPEGLIRRLEVDAPNIPWTMEEAQLMISRYFEVRPGVRIYIDEQNAFARRHGYVVDLFGRRRDISEVHSSQNRVVEAGLRKSVNTPIQSTAAGIIKIHMREIRRLILDMRWEEWVFPLLQIHDDLLFEVRDDILSIFTSAAISIMENAYSLCVPTIAVAKTGKRWGSMKEVGKE